MKSNMTNYSIKCMHGVKNERYKLRHQVGTPKQNTFLRVPISSKLLSFPDTEVYSLDLGPNFLTLLI